MVVILYTKSELQNAKMTVKTIVYGRRSFKTHELSYVSWNILYCTHTKNMI